MDWDPRQRTLDLAKENRVYRRMVERYAKARPRNRLATPGIHEFIIVLDHLKPEYNIGKIFRSADAFGANEVHVVGIGPFDPKPSKGGYKHVPAPEHDDIESCFAVLWERGYTLFAMDPGSSTPIYDYAFPLRSAFIFGHEEFGFSFKPADYPDIRRLAVPQFGLVESLNVSVAASILMYEYTRQHHAGAVGSKPEAD